MLLSLKLTGNYFLSFLFACIVFALFGQQSSVTRDTVITANSEVQTSFAVNTNLDNLAELEVNHFNIIDGDTISVFYGVYNMEEDDPSSFSTFHLDEMTDVITFCIGLFEDEEMYSIVNIVGSSGAPKEFIIN